MSDDYENARLGLPVSDPDSHGAKIGREEWERKASRENPLAASIEGGLIALNDQRAREKLAASRGHGGTPADAGGGLGGLVIIGLIVFVLGCLWDAVAGIINNVDIIVSTIITSLIASAAVREFWNSNLRLPQWPGLSKFVGSLLISSTFAVTAVSVLWLSLTEIRHLDYPRPALPYAGWLWNASSWQPTPTKLERIDGAIALSGLAFVTLTLALWTAWRIRERHRKHGPLDGVDGWIATKAGPIADFISRNRKACLAVATAIVIVWWAPLAFSRQRLVQESVERALSAKQAQAATETARRATQQANEKAVRQGLLAAPTLEDTFRRVARSLVDEGVVSAFCRHGPDEGDCSRRENPATYSLQDGFSKMIEYTRNWRSGYYYDMGESIRLRLVLQLRRPPDVSNVSVLQPSDFNFSLNTTTFNTGVAPSLPSKIGTFQIGHALDECVTGVAGRSETPPFNVRSTSTTINGLSLTCSTSRLDSRTIWVDRVSIGGPVPNTVVQQR